MVELSALTNSATSNLAASGVVLWRQCCDPAALAPFRAQAESLFNGDPLPEHYRFTAYGQAINLAALAIAAPFSEPCLPEHSWLRKRYAPHNAPALYQPNSWHQDGALNRAGKGDELQPICTLWLPLHPCDGDCPTLEFIRVPQSRILHYSLLTDEQLRARFAPDEFWVPPALQPGDALVFSSGTLHRTHVLPTMTKDRLSLEYRFGALLPD